MALVSDRVRAEAVEAIEFPELANQFKVRGVPKSVVNGVKSVDGAVPEQYLLDLIKEAVAEAV